MVLIDLRHRRAAVLAEQGGESQKFSLELPPFGESGLFEDMAASVKLVREALAENGVRDKKCALLLPNSLAESREFRVPRLSRAETLDYIRTNYVDSIGLSEDRLLDYIVVREEGDFCHVLAVSVRREVLRQCGEFSRGLGLRCVSVQLHASAAWKYMRQLQAGNDRAVLGIGLMEERMELMLYAGGRVFTREAEAGAKNTSEANLLLDWAVSFNATAVEERTNVAASIADQVHSMEQFQLNRDRNNPVCELWLYGDATEKLMGEVADLLPELPVRMALGERDSLYVDLMGAAIREKNDLNLLQAARPARKATLSLRAELTKMLLAVLLVALAMAGVYGGIYFKQAGVQRELDEVEAWISNQDHMTVVQQANTLRREIAVRRRYNDILKAFREQFEGQFRLDSGYLTQVRALAQSFSVTVEEFQYQDGTMTLQCAAPSSQSAAEYARALEQRGLAAGVLLKNYTKENDSGLYNFTVEGQVAAQ